MAEPNPKFENGKYYHIANFGIERRLVFTDEKDINRFLDLLDYYRIKNPPQRFAFRKRVLPEGTVVDPVAQIEILAYCIMPDHFHLLIKQNVDKGVHNYVSKIINSYTKYFNAKQKRKGTLFEGPFRATEVPTDQLTNVSRHVHLDPMLKNMVTDLSSFPYSSLPQYTGEEGIINSDDILSKFVTPEEYKNFVMNQDDYKEKLPPIKNMVMD